MSKIGRNKPCPCGSGKKHKICCLLKGASNSQVYNDITLNYKQQINAIIDESPTIELKAKEIDKKKYAEYTEVLSQLQNLLNSGTANNEAAFDLFDRLYFLLCIVGKFDDFFDLTLKLKKNYPEIYKEEGKYIVSMCADLKLRLEQIDEACECFIEFCRLCGDDLGFFYRDMNKLMYYNCHEAIIKGMKEIWPTIKKSDLDDWEKEEFRSKYYYLLYFSKFLHSDKKTSKDQIIKALSDFKFEDLLEDLEKTVSVMVERFSSQKFISDLNSDLNEDDSVRKVIKVFDIFAYHLGRDQILSPCRAMSYWFDVCGYLSARINGHLGINVEDIVSPFSLEEQTLDKYMMDNFTDSSRRNLDIYKAIMFLQGMIYWVVFLFENNLIDSPETILKDISNLYIAIYEFITPERASKKIKIDEKLNLITLHDLIQSYGVENSR